MNNVRDLINEAAANGGHSINLPAGALNDLRKVLQSNARKPRDQRVTVAQFRAYLQKNYKVSVADCTLRRIVQRDLGRGWQ